MINFKANFRAYIVQTRGMKISDRTLRKALVAGVELGVNHWIGWYLDDHFTPDAVRKYKYAARKASWNARKHRARRVRDSSGNYRIAPKPPSPNVYSGEMREYVLSRRSSYAPKVTSNINRYVLKARFSIPIPHVVKKKFHNEITRMTQAEYTEIGRIATWYARHELGIASSRATRRSA